MREGKDSVKLWNREIFENDAPGSGSSNKGVFFEPVYGDIHIKKVLLIADPRCEEATIVLYNHNRPKINLTVSVNGHKTSTHMGHNNSEVYVPIETPWLKKGKNEIVLSCPEAKDHTEGWQIMLSNIEEYREGGWDVEKEKLSYEPVRDEGLIAMIGEKEYTRYPKNIGDYSFISRNGGKSWSTRGKGTHPVAQEEYWNVAVPDQKERYCQK